MTRRPFICGNWKLNHSAKQTREFLRTLRRGLPDNSVDVGIAPVALCVPEAVDATKGSRVLVGVQNVYHVEKGAFTGEWSVAHVVEAGAAFAIIGHSERRQYFAESDESVMKKVRATLDGGLIAIACCGETLAERESGKTLDVVRRQMDAILAGTPADAIDRLVVAYEPVWAIGTGKTASSAQAQEVHAFIRKEIRKPFGDGADRVRIQYGGSVKADNAKELMAEADIDGALVGGASLDAESFTAIVKAAG